MIPTPTLNFVLGVMEDVAFVGSMVKLSATWGGTPAAKRTQNCHENALVAAQIFHAQLFQIFAVFYFVDLGEKRFFEFGNGSHIPHDFAFFFISHFIPGKQHNRRFPDASISQAFSIRRRRVSGCLAELIEKIQSRRAIGVISAHNACASGAAARALRRSTGTLISGSSPARVISTVSVSPAPAVSCKALLTLSQ